jgi:hypothetical protein
MSLTRAALLILSLIALPATTALALTAEEVWADWMRLAREGDVAITATTQREGDRLVVSAITIPVGPPGDTVDLMLDRIDLQDLPDGRVAVLLPPSFPVTIEGPAGSEVTRVILSASAPDLSLVVSGIGQTSAFDLEAPSLALTLDRIEPPPAAGETTEITMALADLVVGHRMDLLAQTQEVSSTASLGALRGEALIDDGKGERVTISLDVASLSSALTAVIPPEVAAAEPRAADAPPNALPEFLAALAAGLHLSGEVSVAGLAMRADLTGSPEGGLVELSLGEGKVAGGLDTTRAFYEVALGQAALTGRDLPDAEFSDIAMSLDAAGYGTSFGIGDLVSPQDARFWAQMSGLTLPTEAWAELDPSGALERGPISWALEVTARYALGPEMLQPDWVPVPDAFPPLDIIEVALAELMFDGLGLRIAGEGALAFDESDLITFEGMPVPEGKLSFTAEGVNSLIDRLGAAGLVPEDELSGLRLGLMFIAKAGTTADSLVSTLEFRDKSVILNGVKMR